MKKILSAILLCVSVSSLASTEKVFLSTSDDMVEVILPLYSSSVDYSKSLEHGVYLYYIKDFHYLSVIYGGASGPVGEGVSYMIPPQLPKKISLNKFKEICEKDNYKSVGLSPKYLMYACIATYKPDSAGNLIPVIKV
jgi:hypothetical protein